MSKTTSILTLALFLGVTPVAVAQTQTDTQAPAAGQEQMNNTQPKVPDTGDQAQSQTPSEQPAAQDNDTSTTVTETPTTPTPQAQSPEPVPGTESSADAKESKPVEGQIVMQDSDSILASSMMGASVYSPNEETIGSISDLLVKTDGTVHGVVIGVGGFLGLGQKSVAIEMNKLTLTPQPDGSAPRLVLNQTKEELEAAPEFKTAAQQAAERQQPATPSPTSPAPAPAPAN